MTSNNVTLNCFSSNLELFIAAVLLLALFIILKKQISIDFYSKIASFLILIGTAHNTYSRLTTHCVFDYFNFFGLFKFNVPDVLISCGVLVLALRLILVENINRRR